MEKIKREGLVVITRNGKAVAVLLALLDDDDLESLILARSPRFRALLDKSRKSIEQRTVKDYHHRNSGKPLRSVN